MRLLNVNTKTFAEFEEQKGVPPYTITSHRRWDDEPSFKDMKKDKAKQHEGFKKVEDFCKFVQDENTRRKAMHGEVQSCDWIWLDTVCINKDSETEVTESINAMFRWYRHAEVCYAYLVDVRPLSAGRDAAMYDFARSSWFTRGWTLQELIAPKQVVFLTSAWEVLGMTRKTAPWHSLPDLGDDVARIAGIPRYVFGEQDLVRLKSLSVEERSKWMQRRETTRVEDLAYSLLGILGVRMSLRYGEGRHAWLRLERKVSKEYQTPVGLPRPDALERRNSGGDSPYWDDPILPVAGVLDRRISNDTEISNASTDTPQITGTTIGLITRQKTHSTGERTGAVQPSIPSYCPNRLGDALLKAAADGDESKVKLSLAKGAACNYRDPSGFTALHHASVKGHEHVAIVLMDAGADVNAQSLKYGTPLCLSALRGHQNMVKLLLNNNASIDNAGRWTGTALHCASWSGSVGVAKALLERGASVTSMNTIWPDFLDYGDNLGYSPPVDAKKVSNQVSETAHHIFDCQPLIVAAHQRQEGLVQLLLEWGFPIDMEHREWWTEHPDDQSFDDVGEDNRCDNLTALMAASWKGPHTLLSKLLTAGAAVNKRDSWGRSPLWIAGETGQLACVQLLVEVGSELDAVSKSGKSALHVAVGAGHVDVVKYLIDKGADIDRADHNGRTPCHFAA